MATNGKSSKSPMKIVDLHPTQRKPDSDYVARYIRHALTEGNMEAPDMSKAGTDYDNLMCLYDQNGDLMNITHVWETVIKPNRPHLADLMKAKRRNLFPIDELADLPPQRFLYDEEIVAGGFNVLYGASGSGKSFVALDYAEAISQERPVVYIAGEGASGYYARHTAWKQHNGKPTGKLYMYLDAVNMLSPTDLQAFIDEIADINPAMVVIDTLARCMVGGDENSAKDTGVFIENCGILQRELDCAVLAVHHTGKSGNSERGSSALRGAADMMIELSNEEGKIKLSCSKSKDSAGFEARYLRLIDCADSCVLVPSDDVILDDNSFTDNQKTVIEWLSSSELFDEGARYSDLQKATSINGSTFYKVLKVLSQRDMIQKEGKYDPWVLTENGKQVAKQFGYC